MVETTPIPPKEPVVKTPAEPPKEPVTPPKEPEHKQPASFDIDALTKEILDDEKKAREEQASKLKDLEDNSVKQGEIKSAVKEVLKKQMQEKTKQEERINELEKQISDIRGGTKTPPVVEPKPFQAPNGKPPQEVVTAENYDKWVLKKFGVLK